MKAVPFAVALTLVFAAASCKSNDSSTTSPSSTTTAPAAASPTTTEQWSGTLAVGTTRFYSFTVLQYGTVNMTVNSLTVGGAASDVTLSAGIGTPSGTTCALTTSGTVQAGSQLTNTFDTGIRCVYIADPGTMSAPVAFTIAIDHP